MCACRQKKSFLIEDILRDTKKKPYKNLSYEPSKPLVCSKRAASEKVASERVAERIENHAERDNQKDYRDYEKSTIVIDTNIPTVVEDKITKLNVITEVQRDIELSKINLEHRRNTYPLYPTAVKPNYPWQYRGKDPMGYMEPRLSYYSEQILNTNQLLRNQLAANRFANHPFAIRQAYGFDRVPPNCCSPWWGLGGRRKGGQVRFTAAQTGALERRFNASKYLSPDERRSLASTLRLSDRQVKTWFQNRRAKWRRTTPDSADTGSPPTSADDDDDDVQIADDDSIL